jgi:hypothetical protein
MQPFSPTVRSVAAPVTQAQSAAPAFGATPPLVAQPTDPIALSPLSPVSSVAPVAAQAPAQSTQQARPAPSGGSAPGSALGLLALVGAAGIVVLRIRQFAADAGLADGGTLTALAHAATTFWAGSCLPLATTASTTAAGVSAGTVNASLQRPGIARGRREQFDVKGAVSGPLGSAGSPAAPPALALTEGTTGGDGDRAGLVVALFTVSAMIGAAFGALSPRRHETA